MGTLAGKIAKASIKLGGSLSKDKTNTSDRYSYVSADSIIASAGQCLASVGVTVFPAITSTEVVTFDRGQGKFRYDARVQFCFIVADDESQMELIWPGYGSDYTVPDKAIYKAITSGHKYFLAKLLCIGADNEDGEHETEASATLAGSTNEGPNTCPSCRAPVGKIHANNCQVPTPKTTVQPTTKQAAQTAQPKQAAAKVQDAPPADFTLDSVPAIPFETDASREFAAIPSASAPRPRWNRPDEAYAWAIESGACANEFEAKNSLKKITDERFDGKLTGNNLQSAFDAFYARQLEKLVAAAA